MQIRNDFLATVDFKQRMWILEANKAIQQFNLSGSEQPLSPLLISGKCFGLTGLWFAEMAKAAQSIKPNNRAHFLLFMLNMIVFSQPELKKHVESLNQKFNFDGSNLESFINFIKKTSLIQDLGLLRSRYEELNQVNLKKPFGAELLTDVIVVGGADLSLVALKMMSVTKSRSYGYTAGDHIIGFFLNKEGTFIVYDSNESHFTEREIALGGKPFKTLEEVVSYCDVQLRKMGEAYDGNHFIRLLEYSFDPYQDKKFIALLKELISYINSIEQKKDDMLNKKLKRILHRYKEGNLALEQTVVCVAQLLNIQVRKTYENLIYDLGNTAAINLQTKFNRSLLHGAVVLNDVYLVQYLLSKGLSIGLAEKQDQQTPLHLAVAYENFEVAEVLVDQIVRTNPSLLDATDIKNLTPLEYAAIQGATDMASLLLRAQAKKSQRSIESHENLLLRHNTGGPLLFACEAGHLSMVKLLLEWQPETIDGANHKGESALIKAVANGHSEVVALLLAHHANPRQEDLDNNTPISIAIDNKNFKILAMLITHDTAAEKTLRKHQLASEQAVLTAQEVAEIFFDGNKKGFDSDVLLGFIKIICLLLKQATPYSEAVFMAELRQKLESLVDTKLSQQITHILAKHTKLQPGSVPTTQDKSKSDIKKLFSVNKRLQLIKESRSSQVATVVKSSKEEVEEAEQEASPKLTHTSQQSIFKKPNQSNEITEENPVSVTQVKNKHTDD